MAGCPERYGLPSPVGVQREPLVVWLAEEEFEALPFAEQWDRTIAAYRDSRGPDGHWWLTLAPESFHAPSHQDGLTAFDAFAEPEVPQRTHQ